MARFRDRGRGGPREVARALGAVGGTLGGFGAGLALGSVNRLVGNGTRRDALDLGLGLAGDLGTALAGLALQVHGAEHLSARPAVFLFNHQSQLDVLILAKLLRGGFTAVAKKEAASIPGFGAAFRLADVAFVDRSDTGAARAALEPAVTRLREGLSLVIAPEGTRSTTPALGAFKKGAFHVAMQAGVPIVPIVVHNAGELMWRGARTVREGTVVVTVLPPVETDGWVVEDLDERVAEVRNRYLDALGQPRDLDPRPDVHLDRVPRNAIQVPDAPVPAAPGEDVPLDWGTEPVMDASAASVWRAESGGPRSTFTVLEVLDRPPTASRLAGAHEWASRMVPRMRQVVVEPALGFGTPMWVDSAHLDLDRHLRRVRLPEPGSTRQLLDVVAEFSAEPLDRTRPLWSALLVEGVAGGRAAYAVTIHQSVTDGVGALRLLGMVHSRTAEHDPARPEPPAPDIAPPPSPWAVLAGEVALRGAGVVARPWETGLGVAAGAARVAGRVLGGLLDAAAGPTSDSAGGWVDGQDGVVAGAVPGRHGGPWAEATRGGAAGGSLGRAGTARAGASGRSRLLAGRGGRRRVELLEVPVSALQAGAAAAGGSATDGFLAAVLGALRDYHLRLDGPDGADDVTVALGLPVGLGAEDGAGGRLVGAVVEAPLTADDVATRVRAVREFVLATAGGAVPGNGASDVLGLLGLLEGVPTGPRDGSGRGAVDVQVAAMPGIGHPVHLAGARIDRLHPLGPLAGCAATLTMVAHDGTYCVGVLLDDAAVTAADVLVGGLQAGLDEVVALGGTGGS